MPFSLEAAWAPSTLLCASAFSSSIVCLLSNSCTHNNALNTSQAHACNQYHAVTAARSFKSSMRLAIEKDWDSVAVNSAKDDGASSMRDCRSSSLSSPFNNAFSSRSF